MNAAAVLALVLVVLLAAWLADLVLRATRAARRAEEQKIVDEFKSEWDRYIAARFAERGVDPGELDDEDHP